MPQKILVVDEKPFMVRLIQHHLQKAGYELIQARNKQEAVDAVARETPDVVVLDESHTQMDPVNLNEITKNSGNVPVIRMTDTPDLAEERNGRTEIVVSKPFSPTRLVAEIKRLSTQGKVK